MCTFTILYPAKISSSRLQNTVRHLQQYPHVSHTNVKQNIHCHLFYNATRFRNDLSGVGSKISLKKKNKQRLFFNCVIQG